MRRPLCAFCFSALGAQLAFLFLPQAVLWPLAAFCAAIGVGACLWNRRRGHGPGYAACLLAGTVLGLLLACGGAWRMNRLTWRYDSRELRLTARVESVSASYYEGTVRAQLWVEQADGQRAGFRCLCICMPTCEAGERITGRFTLAAPGTADRIDRYADGIAFLAEYQDGLRSGGNAWDFRSIACRVQRRLSAALRQGMSADAGGVLAAMTVGDRSSLSAELNAAYRAAGLSHVLVVSGMHVSILCGGALTGRAAGKKRERSRKSRVAQAAASMGAATLLAGVTGFTPSVLRAGGAVWISAIGVLVYGPADALTSLGVAGVCMTLGNSYAACDVGFELSFAAVAGTLTGAELARRAKDTWGRRLPQAVKGLLETVCISACASAATFPVLVLRGMSASLYALVSSVAVLWLVQPILLCGLGAALTGLLPLLAPLYRLFALAGELLAGALNAWARMAAGWPGAQLYFETKYAALVSLTLIGLGLLAARWKVRLRWAAPALLMTAAAAVSLGNALSRDVVSVALLGSSRSPVVVVTENRQAMVLFRGGSSEQYAVEQYLAQHSIDGVELLVDLRTSPGTACTLEAGRTVSMAELTDYRTVAAGFGDVEAELFCTRSGHIVRLTVDGRRLVTLSGSAELAQRVHADWLLASAARPDSFACDNILTLSGSYAWLEGTGGRVVTGAPGLTLRLRPGGGVCIKGAAGQEEQPS